MLDAALNVPEIMKMIGELADCVQNPETHAALAALADAVMAAAQGQPLTEAFAVAA
jgi:hypothetical protein